jgi:hypothetical protein
MLGVAPGVMPDVGDIADVHGKQRELTRDGLPAEASRDGRGITPLQVRTGLEAHPAAHHDLGVRCRAGDDAVQQDRGSRFRSCALAEAGITGNSPFRFSRA